MASTAKCPFCGAVVTSDQKQCPDCGADNLHYVEDRPERITHPTTIDELKEYCAERGMPLLRMRFFIGEDYKEPRAFGIYRDGDCFTVYKNKADGSRAVRYSGTDEKYAVNELWQKLLQECHNRGIYPDGRDVPDRAGNTRRLQPKKRAKRIILFIAIALFACLVIYSKVDSCVTSKPLSKGYYFWNNTPYYTEGGSYYYNMKWYSYDDTGWKLADKPKNSIGLRRSYRGDTVAAEWGIRAIPLHEVPEKGYYQYGSLYYCDKDTHWHKYDTLDKCWISSSAPSASDNQRLLFLSDYYLGPDFREDMPGFDYLTDSGYYRKDGKTWHYDKYWYLYDGKGWKKADSPGKINTPYFKGVECQEEWDIRPFLTGKPREGYYRYDNQAYYYSTKVGSSSKWAEYDTSDRQWGYSRGFPANDSEGYLLYPEDYYGGSSFPAEWQGRDYEFKEGYYRYQGVTYYFSKKSPEWQYVFFPKYGEQLYRYENGWRRSDYPVGNLSSYYEGLNCQKAWECTDFHLPEMPECGYYRYEDDLYYAIQIRNDPKKTSYTISEYSARNPWYLCKSGYWAKSSFPIFDANDYLIHPEDYYLGADYSAEWGKQAFFSPETNGYYTINNNIYYKSGQGWYKKTSYSGWKELGYSPLVGDIDVDYAGYSMPGSGKDFYTWQNEERQRELEVKQKNNNSNNRWGSDRWDNDDYDDWDAGDTDWDSDW